MTNEIKPRIMRYVLGHWIDNNEGGESIYRMGKFCKNEDVTKLENQRDQLMADLEKARARIEELKRIAYQGLCPFHDLGEEFSTCICKGDPNDQ